MEMKTGLPRALSYSTAVTVKGWTYIVPIGTTAPQQFKIGILSAERDER